MMTLADALWLFALVTRELTVFAAFGFTIFGASDLLVDLIWIARSMWRRVYVYSRYRRADASQLVAHRPGRIAIFVPAWDEASVIGAMLRRALATIPAGNWCLYVGTYPNDPATTAAVRQIADPRVRLVTGTLPGPTTKADCLNFLWDAMCADEIRDGQAVKAVVLHDAEDVIHPGEPALYDAMIERFAMVQIPVMPLPDPSSRWIAGHYLDEFAESHGKTMVVREALGAAIPAAGVGCAFDRAMLGRIAAARGAAPFDADSLTEDYELGLRIAELGGRGAFVRLAATPGAAPVAVHAHFPDRLGDAVRQKSRWIAGIALSGWDRMGWRGGLAEIWMRLDDRRPPLAALVTLAAYAAIVMAALTTASRAVLGVPPAAPITGLAHDLLLVSAFLLAWRLMMRAWMVTLAYGPVEGLRAVPRAVVGNIIAMMAARRAIGVYLRGRRGVVTWDKTAHRFPAELSSPTTS